MSPVNDVLDTRPEEITGRTVVGLFSRRAAAKAAIRDLQKAGFPSDHIGVAMQERVEQGDLLESVGGEGVRRFDGLDWSAR
jgi:hypothetical protein